MLGRLLQLFGFPGLVRPFEYRDTETGRIVRLRTSRHYSVLSIGDKELYFYRENGRLDGAGAMSDADATRLNHLRAGRIRRSAPRRAAP
jgi:hypothetical protein